jgi:hypothetical protein
VPNFLSWFRRLGADVAGSDADDAVVAVVDNVIVVVPLVIATVP